MEILNQTPFQAKNLLLQDEQGRDQLVVLVKASYEFTRSGELSIAEQQQPINLKDIYYDDPESSSLKYESEATLCKTTTNIVIHGSAYGANRISQLDIGIRTQNINKVARVFGKRYWMKKYGSLILSSPANFESISLKYENAFGGTDTSFENHKYHEMERRNYLGKGFTAKKSSLHLEQIQAPDIENPAFLISSIKDRPEPAGFGFVSPNWEPRVNFAGTFDESWKEHKAPLLPDDFKREFYNSASRGLTSANYFRGGELIELANISGYRQLRIEIPRIEFEIVNVNTVQNRSVMTPYLNTILIEADNKRVTILWKATECVYKNIQNLWFTRVKANV